MRKLTHNYIYEMFFIFFINVLTIFKFIFTNDDICACSKFTFSNDGNVGDNNNKKSSELLYY